MNHPLASIFMRGTIYDSYVIPFLVALVVVAFAARYWRFFIQWLREIRGRDWIVIAATIDVVSVVEQIEHSRSEEIVATYLATLTYFYRNPELQMGEYSRMFDDEDAAQAWTASYKGSTVMVHVDPYDPSHSVLRKEAL